MRGDRFDCRSVKEDAMARKFIDCREYPSEMNCTIAISADSDDEVVEAAAQHAMSVHKHPDSPELRTMLRSAVKEGSPA
jgi:predicted small metal-binding protein